jgi:hypothetical protein
MDGRGSRKKRCGLDSQALAALRAACIQDGAAVAGGHADAETVGALAANDGRLESTFHDDLANFCKKVKWERRRLVIGSKRHGKSGLPQKVPPQRIASTQRAVNPELDRIFRFSVNYLAAFSRSVPQPAPVEISGLPVDNFPREE